MTLADINAKITSLLGGVDTYAYPNSDRLVDINIWYQKVVSMILDAQDEVDYDDPNQTTLPIYKTSLTTNRNYGLPAALNFLKVKDLSVCYDGTNIYRASPFDIAGSILPVSDPTNVAAEAKIDANMSRTSPRYDWRFGSIFLYPKPTQVDVDAGGYMMAEFYRGPVEFTLSDLTTGTAVPGFDISFHAMLAYGPAFEYATAKSLPQLKAVAAGLADFEARLKRQYSSKQTDTRYQFTGDYQSYK